MLSQLAQRHAWRYVADTPIRGILKAGQPEEDRLVFFVREAFPGVATGCRLGEGELAEAEELRVISEMNHDGVVFGDGIEDDRLAFGWGQTATIRVARQKLQLVVSDGAH